MALSGRWEWARGRFRVTVDTDFCGGFLAAKICVTFTVSEPYRSLARRLANTKIGQDLERTKIRKKKKISCSRYLQMILLE